jgi:hypothetical protein
LTILLKSAQLQLTAWKTILLEHRDLHIGK